MIVFLGLVVMLAIPLGVFGDTVLVTFGVAAVLGMRVAFLVLAVVLVVFIVFVFHPIIIVAGHFLMGGLAGFLLFLGHGKLLS